MTAPLPAVDGMTKVGLGVQRMCETSNAKLPEQSPLNAPPFLYGKPSGWHAWLRFAFVILLKVSKQSEVA